jgi:PAS domain S-box-containing protein
MNNQPYTGPTDVYLKSTPPYSSATDEKQKADFPTTEQLYNAVFENAFHPMYIGSSNGEIIRFNVKLCKMFGYSKTEMAEHDCSDIFEIQERSFINFLSKRHEKGIAKAEVTGIRKNGQRFPCRISSVFYLSDDGLERSMNTIVDISKSLSARWNIAAG